MLAALVYPTEVFFMAIENSAGNEMGTSMAQESGHTQTDESVERLGDELLNSDTSESSIPASEQEKEIIGDPVADLEPPAAPPSLQPTEFDAAPRREAQIAEEKESSAADLPNEADGNTAEVPLSGQLRREAAGLGRR